MRKYEVIFIVKPMEEEATNAVIEKFVKLIQTNGGTIDKEDRWGKKRLAYEIKDYTDGYYCLLNVTAEPACMKECDRVMKITDDLLKHMIVRAEELVAAGKAAGTDVVLSLPIGEKGDAYNMEPIYTAGGGYLFGKDANGDYLADDLGVGGEGSIAAAKKIGALGAEGVLRNSITLDNAISLFTEGKAPYLVSGPWALGDIKKAGINYTIAKIPGFGDIEGSAATPFAGVNCFYVASKGKNRAFAETLVADVAKDSSFAEAMFPLNELPPAQKDLADKLKSSNPDMVTFFDIANNATPMPSIPKMAEIWQPLGQAEANIINGKDASSEMQAAGKSIKDALGI